LAAASNGLLLLLLRRHPSMLLLMLHYVKTAPTCRQTRARKYMLANRLNWWSRFTGRTFNRLSFSVTSSLLAKAPGGRRLSCYKT